MTNSDERDTAYLSTAFIGRCEVHDERSTYGLPIGDAEDWVLAHNAQSHGAHK